MFTLRQVTRSDLVGEGTLGLGAGASVKTGIGIFSVMDHMMLNGMAEAAKKRSADLHTLVGKPLSACPLKVFPDQNPKQMFTLSTNKIANPAADFSRVTDIVLGLEYSASLDLVRPDVSWIVGEICPQHKLKCPDRRRINEAAHQECESLQD
jgi:hypothetical protein